MTTPILAQALRALPLKDMDPVLLRSAVMSASAELGHDLVALDEAIDLAAYAHRTQLRANRGPMANVHYIEHPLRLALRLLRYGVTDAEVIIAAVLHDTVEDGAETLALLLLGRSVSEAEARGEVLAFYSGHFSPRVAHLVDAVTNELPGEDRPVKAERNRLYVEHILSVIDDAGVFAVKFSDFVDNALSLHHTFAGGNQKMVPPRAVKYLPLIEPFTARTNDQDVLTMMSEYGVEQMRRHLQGHRLHEFAAMTNV